MSEKRRGLGRGLGALIPSNPSPPARSTGDRPVDVFFPGRTEGEAGEPETVPASNGQGHGGRPESLTSGVLGAAGERSTLAVGGRAVAGLGGGTVSTLPGARSPGAGTGGRGLGAGIGSIATVPSALLSPLPGTSPAQAGRASSDGVAPAGTGGEGAGDGVTSPSTAAGLADARAELDGLVPVPGAQFAELPVDAIQPNPKQPRQVFDEDALSELVHSVREIGVLQPVVVRRVGDAEDGQHRYELIMGERRLRACVEAGLERIPAIIRDTGDDDLLRDALLENLHRAQLNALEEAAAYQQLLDDFGCTHEELATRIGRSRPQISNTLRLLKLPPLVQRRVAAAVLSAGHARALLGLEDAAAMERLAQRIVAEGLSVRAVEEIVAIGDGQVSKPVKRRPRAGSHTSELDDLASRLGDRLDTRVAIALGRSKGRISIDFASVDDLNRILGMLTPQLKGAFNPEP